MLCGRELHASLALQVPWYWYFHIGVLWQYFCFALPKKVLTWVQACAGLKCCASCTLLPRFPGPFPSVRQWQRLGATSRLGDWQAVTATVQWHVWAGSRRRVKWTSGGWRRAACSASRRQKPWRHLVEPWGWCGGVEGQGGWSWRLQAHRSLQTSPTTRVQGSFF